MKNELNMSEKSSTMIEEHIHILEAVIERLEQSSIKLNNVLNRAMGPRTTEEGAKQSIENNSVIQVLGTLADRLKGLSMVIEDQANEINGII